MKIKIDYKKCGGCKMCEVACSLKHTGNASVQRSRIRIFVGERFCIPVIAGPYTEAMCNSRNIVRFEDIEISECILCRASCPAKSVFREPRIEIPLKCDFCGDPPDPECVKWCPAGALTIES